MSKRSYDRHSTRLSVELAHVSRGTPSAIETKNYSELLMLTMTLTEAFAKRSWTQWGRK